VSLRYFQLAEVRYFDNSTARLDMSLFHHVFECQFAARTDTA